MSKFLYGAAVQGIQDFIFQTNKLQEIVGASELVEQVCTTAFDEFAVNNGESIVRAAGNIKFIFEKKDDCAKAVREFPKKVMTMAPGITISQAVVALSDDFNDDDFAAAIDELESKLKVQRNKPPKSVTLGLMGIKRANNTGLPVVKSEAVFDKDGKKVLDENGKQKMLYLDDATSAKLSKKSMKKLCENSFGSIDGELALEISDITDKNDWIAIIHADGNGLGQVVQKIGKKKDKFRTFSQTLDLATQKAAQAAYSAVVKEACRKKDIIPARPVVLSGDDMTIIIRADIAVEYATAFIRAFEKFTGKDMSTESGKILGGILKDFNVFEKEKEEKNYLTACAGIAFIKSSYPFYYGYQLAEELCGQAKKDTKAIYGAETNHLPPSCLMFHKVQDSFVIDYKDIVERELTAKDGLSFKAGPYYIHQQDKKRTVENLIEASRMISIDNEDGIKSGIRNWISLRIEDKNKADQRLNRMLQIFSDESAIRTLTCENDNSCIAYDVLAYNTIIHQQTR